MRIVPQQFLAGPLIVFCGFAFALPADGQKYINRPQMIGHRDVAHKVLFISSEKEIEIGRQYSAQAGKTAKLVEDPAVQQYVRRIAENIVRHSDYRGPFAVKVVRSSVVSASSLPGGFIYLSSGLLLATENEDEIAVAIAHQVAHAAARTWASEQTQATLLEIAVCAGFLTLGRTSAIGYSTPLALLHFRRQDELEADYLGLQYMYEAGYNPNVFVGLLRKLEAGSPAKASEPTVLQAMPPVSQRIAQAEKEIREILPNPHGPNKSSPEFALMKSALENLPEKAPAQGPKLIRR